MLVLVRFCSTKFENRFLKSNCYQFKIILQLLNAGKVDIEALRKRIKEKYPHESFYARNFGSYSYKEYNKINNSIYIEHHNIEGLKIYKSKILYSIINGMHFFF